MLKERIYSFVLAVTVCVLCAAGGYAMARQWAYDESWDRPEAVTKETEIQSIAAENVLDEELPSETFNPVQSGETANTTVTEPEKKSLGKFTITYYCACPKCCGKWSNEENPLTASGARAEAGVTVGADWETLPEGTEIEIEGLGRRVVQDKPAEWIVEKYDGRIIDVFCDSHEEALKLGKQEAEVWAWD